MPALIKVAQPVLLGPVLRHRFALQSLQALLATLRVVNMSTSVERGMHEPAFELLSGIDVGRWPLHKQRDSIHAVDRDIIWHNLSEKLLLAKTSGCYQDFCSLQLASTAWHPPTPPHTPQ
jgi:hypothetical protein